MPQSVTSNAIRAMGCNVRKLPRAAISQNASEPMNACLRFAGDAGVVILISPAPLGSGQED